MRSKFLILTTLFLSVTLVQAQDTAKASDTSPQTPEPYQLTLTFKITDHGKLTTDQTFTLAAANQGHDGFGNPSVRDGDRIPIATGGEGAITQFQYVDVGTNIDVNRLLKIGSMLGMQLQITSSTAVPPAEPSSASLKNQPILRTLKYSLVPIVPLGKLTTIYSSGDGVSSQKVEIQLLAQPLGAK